MLYSLVKACIINVMEFGEGLHYIYVLWSLVKVCIISVMELIVKASIISLLKAYIIIYNANIYLPFLYIIGKVWAAPMHYLP